MNTERQDAALAALARHFHPDNLIDLFTPLPAEEAKRVMHAQAGYLPPHEWMRDSSTLIEQIHYSWLESASPLWSQAPSPAVREFFSSHLCQTLGIDKQLPQALLPPSSFNLLLDLDKHKFVQLIGMIGIYDLAALFRRSVIPEQQRKIRESLSPEQRTHFEQVLRQQDLLPPPSADLSQIASDKRQLTKFCQVQGLHRLGHLLHSEDPSLIWHLAHQLDTGRGKLLVEATQRPVDASLKKRLTEQLLDLTNKRDPE